MKANELMIGDWVFNKNINKPMQVYPMMFSQMFRQRSDATTEDYNIFPIPLTSEILEANGWEKVAQPGCANPFHWQMEKYEDNRHDEAYLLYRIKAYETFFRGMLVTIHYPSVCEPISFRKQIEYVHQFQHALRDCDIDKEIIVKEE